MNFVKLMFDPRKDLIPCNYRNEATTVQIVRICKPMSGCFERTVMPGQIVHFNATEDSVLEVYEANMASSVQVDTFRCKQLRSISINNSNLMKQEISAWNQSLSKVA